MLTGAVERWYADGRYTLEYSAAHGGALVGKSTVKITTGPLEDRSRRSETVHAKYNDKSEVVVEVKSARNTFDFDVQPK